MLKGKVKFFDDTRGFGFITQESGEKDLFVHKSGCIDKLKEGDSVEYETESGPKGLNACKVRRVG